MSAFGGKADIGSAIGQTGSNTRQASAIRISVILAEASRKRDVRFWHKADMSGDAMSLSMGQLICSEAIE